MQEANSEVEKAWFTIEELETERVQNGRAYLEFLRVPTMSAGLYALEAGARDPQQPHGEDEIYYVVSGKGMILVGSEDKPVGPGSVVFVGARVEHRFHSIEEDLKILVVFAPPSGSAGRSNRE